MREFSTKTLGLVYTHSATAGALRDTVLASTTNATTLVSARCSTNCPRNLACPGMSIAWKDFLGDRVIVEVFICIDVCVGKT